MYTSIGQIDKTDREKFYSSESTGAFVIRDPAYLPLFTELLSEVASKNFTLKDHPEINNTQEHCPVDQDFLTRKINSFAKSIMELYTEIIDRLSFVGYQDNLQVSCSITRYPSSASGSAFHQDFSRNMNLVVTLFLGQTTFLVAKDRKGSGLMEYLVEFGDILVMRAPRNTSQEEKALRPIHAIGEIKSDIYTLEIRQLNSNLG